MDRGTLMQSLQNTKLLINEAKNLGAEFEIVNDKVTISAPEAIPQDLLSELKKKKHLVLQIIMNDIDASKDQLNISNKNPQKINIKTKKKLFPLNYKISISKKYFSRIPKTLIKKIKSINVKTISINVWGGKLKASGKYIFNKTLNTYGKTKKFVVSIYFDNSEVLLKKISQINLNLTQFQTKKIASITFEFGVSKILICEKNQIVDCWKVNLPTSHFQEGLVIESQMTSNLIEYTLNENGVSSLNLKIFGAVPGYQTSIRDIELPRFGKINPNSVIPIQMQQKFGISSEISKIKWIQYDSESDKNKWLAISSTKKSIKSWVSSVSFTKKNLFVLEPKPFAITRALNFKDVVCVYLSEDGCDVIVIRNGIPLTYQTAYWGQQFSIEKEEIFDKISDVLINTLNEHNLTHDELNIGSFVPLIFAGQIKDSHISYIDNISKNINLTNTKLDMPIQLPNGFKTDDFLINLGLLMSQKKFKID